MAHTQREEQLIETTLKESQILSLPGKEFKLATINVFKEKNKTKEITAKELKKSMRKMTHQIENIYIYFIY